MGRVPDGVGLGAGRDRPGPDGARAATRYVLYGLLLLAPLPFGSVEPRAVMGVELVAAGLAALSLWIVFRDPGGVPGRTRAALAAAGVLVGVGVLQTVPLPASWVRTLAAAAAESRDAVGAVVPEAVAAWRPLSLSPPETVDALLRLVAYVAIGLAAALGHTERRHLRQTAVVLMVSGAFQAAYGSAEYLSGHQQIFGYVKKHFLDSATGTFINRNHFASYLAMILPFALGLLVSRGGEGRRLASRRARLVRWVEAQGLARVAAGAAVVLLWGAIFFSYSRGGLAAAFVGTVIFGLAAGARDRRPWLAAVALLFPLALFLLWQDVRSPGERFLGLASGSGSLGNRVPVWNASLRIVRDHPLVGTGYGTFESAFALYRPHDIRYRWDHAHNDWLQLQVEGGAVATLALVGMLYALLRRRRAEEEPSLRVLHGAPALAAVGAAAFHGMTDFTLRIPGAAVLLAFVLGTLGARVARPAAVRLFPGPLRAGRRRGARRPTG